jgi:hypothetical protein
MGSLYNKCNIIEFIILLQLLQVKLTMCTQSTTVTYALKNIISNLKVIHKKIMTGYNNCNVTVAITCLHDS